jgi:hypothetical protein
VEHLTFVHKTHGQSSEENREVDHTNWYQLLGSLSNVKTLLIDDRLVVGFRRCLQLGDATGELHLDYLTRLRNTGAHIY